jgi:hypothetical protein
MTAKACCPTSPSPIRIAPIKFVDVLFRSELFDLQRALAFDRDGFEFFRIELDVLALGDP